MKRLVLAALGLWACGDGVEMLDGSFDAGELACVSEDDVVRFVFEPTCATSRCHDANVPSAGLDLQTPGIAGRLVGRTSVHARCSDQELLVPGDPAASFMMRKVLGSHDDCGDAMPSRGQISPAQRRCIALWITNAD